MKPRDALVLLIAATLCAVAFLLTASHKSGVVTGRVLVYQDGQLVAEGRLGQESDIVIDGENGQRNIVHITESGVTMAYSSCKNQLCVLQGEMTSENVAARALGNRVICLPNRVEVELVLASQGDVPDI